MQALLKASASVNARDVSGRTALTLCAKRGDVAALRLLLQWGADCNDKTFGSGETPLHAAILARAPLCVLELTAMICPVTRCPKSLLNGPCGGQDKGKASAKA